MWLMMYSNTLVLEVLGQSIKWHFFEEMVFDPNTNRYEKKKPLTMLLSIFLEKKRETTSNECFK